MSDAGEPCDEVEYRPHSSADYEDMDYVDERGIRVFDEDWTCPNCGDDGKMMFRPGSKNTCTECFWVLNGRKNDYVLEDWPLKYRHAQQLLAELGDDWHGTPGSVATNLRKHFDHPEEAEQAFRQFNNGEKVATDGGTTTLGDFT
jgi:hypothetical protein